MSFRSGSCANRRQSLPLLLCFALLAGAAALAETNGIQSSATSPGDIAAGPDGNLWFPLVGSDLVGRIRPTGEVSEFPVPGAAALGRVIASGPGGKLWLTGSGVDGRAHVWSMAASGSSTDVAILSESASSFQVPGITPAVDGNVWIAYFSEVLRVSPSGQVTRFPLAGAADVTDAITTGPDGNLWIIGSEGPFVASRQVLVRMTLDGTATPVLTQTSSGASAPTSIILGPDGNLWLADYGYQQVVRVSLDPPTRTIFPFSGASRLASGPDGNVWITTSRNLVARMAPDGRVTELGMPTSNSDPSAIAAGPDGNLWFTEPRSQLIGRITPAGVVTEFSIGPARRIPLYAPHTPRRIESR